MSHPHPNRPSGPALLHRPAAGCRPARRGLARLTFAAAAVAGSLLLSACQPSAPGTDSVAGPLPGVGGPAAMNSAPSRVFYSGHSLMDQPLPDQVAAIAQAEGQPLQWERQYLFGSLLRQRTQGPDPSATAWTGWTAGDNRQGQGLDTAAALGGRLAGLPPFDTLIVTERHDILWAQQNEGTARFLRRMHDARVEGQPQGSTWLYESWQSMSPASIPAWVAYENAVGGAWQCVASEVNRSLEAEGREDRVRSLPVARALAWMVGQATQGAGLAGITAGTPSATVERIFRDAVHLTEAGSYYAALVTWAFVHGRPAAVEGGWTPAGVDPALARGLRAAAAEAHRQLAGQTLAVAPAEACQARLAALCPVVWSYMASRWRDEGQSWPKARWQQFKLERQCEAAVRDGRHRLIVTRDSTGERSPGGG